MEQYIFTKKQFLEQLNTLIKDDEAILYSTILQGSMRGSSKNRLKGFEIGFTNDCFKDSQTISDIIQTHKGGLILLKKEHWNDDIKEYMEKQNKQEKTSHK